MRHAIAFVAAFLLILLTSVPTVAQTPTPTPCCCCCPCPSPTPTPVPTPSPTPDPSPTVTPTPTPTPTVTPTPTPEPSPSPTPSPSPSPSPPPATTFSLYTANLAHGRNTSLQYNYANQAQILSTADVVLGQEASVGDLSQWDTVFTAAGFTRAVFALNSPSAGDGQAIWIRTSKVSLVQAFSKQLSSGFISWDGSTNVDKSAVAIKVVIAGRTLIIVNPHLCWSRCADSQSVIETTGASQQRVSQIKTLLTWINQTFPDEAAQGMVIKGGDYNLTPVFTNPTDGGTQLELITTSYHDLWQLGIASNKAFADWGDHDNNGQPDMPVDNLLTRTADKRRIDYVFLKRNSTFLSLERIELPDVGQPCPHALVAGGNFPACSPEVVQQWDIIDDARIRPADHNWLKVTFRIN